MKINKVSLINFRNYKNCEISFDDNINLVLGNNAQGKTNLLESIYFCAIGKSPRTKKEHSLIKYDCPFANIGLEFETKSGNKNISITINSVGKKIIKINDMQINKLSSLVGELKVVYFSPDELRLIKDMPEDRRRFLDISISQYDHSYLLALSRYDKLIKQMNAILKNHLSIEDINAQLAAFVPQFIACAEKIISSRVDFVSKISTYAQYIHSKLTGGEQLSIAYSFTMPKYETLKDYLTSQLKTTLPRACELGYILVGPHRDDLSINIENKNAKVYASQGQQRCISLSLKLASMELMRDECGEYPILLLDDVMSELDSERETKLCSLINNYQTLISSTRDCIESKKKTISIRNGQTI